MSKMETNNTRKNKQEPKPETEKNLKLPCNQHD